MEGLSRVSWLFIRGSDTVRINFSADTLSLDVSGPGHERKVFKFGDQATAAEFLKLNEYFLTGGGWVLQAFVERRSDRSSGSPPQGRERRRGAGLA